MQSALHGPPYMGSPNASTQTSTNSSAYCSFSDSSTVSDLSGKLADISAGYCSAVDSYHADSHHADSHHADRDHADSACDVDIASNASTCYTAATSSSSKGITAHPRDTKTPICMHWCSSGGQCRVTQQTKVNAVLDSLCVALLLGSLCLLTVAFWA